MKIWLYERGVYINRVGLNFIIGLKLSDVLIDI